MVHLATLVASCIGALVTQLSGIASIGELFGIPVWQLSVVAAAGLLAIVWTGSYRSVELAAIAVGMCELAFIVLACLARPSVSDFLAQATQVPLGDHRFLFLVAANLGTCRTRTGRSLRAKRGNVEHVFAAAGAGRTLGLRKQFSTRVCCHHVAETA